MKRTSSRQSSSAVADRWLSRAMFLAAIPVRVVWFALCRPGKTFMAVLLGGASFAIIGNALTGQAELHPSPFFQTRATEVVPPKDESRVIQGNPRAADRHAGRAESAAPSPATSTSSNADVQRLTEADRQLLRAIQKSLSKLGHYDGDLDGLRGPRTEAAIRDYERNSGLPLTGRPSIDLMNSLTFATAVASATRAKTEQSSGTDALGQIIDASKVIPSPRPQDSRVVRVQQALSKSGYGPIDVDGLFGQQTAGAIERFERDRGLAVTGRITDQLVSELAEAGALTN